MVRVRSGSGRIGSPASRGMLEAQRIEQSGQMPLHPSRWARRNHPDASRGDRLLVLRAEPIATVEYGQHGRCARLRCAGSGGLPHAGTLACWRQNRPGCNSAGRGHIDGTADLADRSEHTSAAARRLARARRRPGPPTLRSMRSCCSPSTSAQKRDLEECEQVLAAGRLGSQASQSYAWLTSHSVCTWLAASRVRFAGLRPPLTQPTTCNAAQHQTRHLTSE